MFKHGREYLEDDEHNGRPRSNRSHERIMKGSGILKRDRCDKHHFSDPKERFKEKECICKFCSNSLNNDQKSARVFGF